MTVLAYDSDGTASVSLATVVSWQAVQCGGLTEHAEAAAVGGDVDTSNKRYASLTAGELSEVCCKGG